VARGLIIGAPRSGAGKTTITLALLAALRRRGVRVRAAKSGPDYIDPAFHAAATGAPCPNLDSWAMPPAMLDAVAAGVANDAEIVLIESAMGLFDGVEAGAGRTGAAADLAARWRLPVLLVLDVSGQSQTAAAVARGFATHADGVRIAGVVLNRVGSERHHAQVARALAAIEMPVLGSVPREAAIALPERHLGLVQATEHGALPQLLHTLADLAERTLDLDTILAAAAPFAPEAQCKFPLPGQEQPPLPMWEGAGGRGRAAPASERQHPSPNPLPQGEGASSPTTTDFGQSSNLRLGASLIPPPGQRIALARDAAFSFVYPHLLDGWRRQGAEIVAFSPLANQAPPDGCDACWLPGGYPELHGATLANATTFIAGTRRFAEMRPVHGECGGHMVLGTALTDADGATHPMLGLLGHATSFSRRKLHLGYRRATLLADGVLGRTGGAVRGHEFHYATITEAGGDPPLATLADALGRHLGPAGGRRGRVSGSFFHAIAPCGDPP